MASSLNKAFSILAVFALLGCGSTGKAPEPGDTTGPVPDLRGRRILVLPVQLTQGVPNGVTIDEEIAYALPARSDRVSWAFAPEVERMLRRSPGIQADPRALDVAVFLQAQVNRIGDPLFGEIRRMTELVGADLALIPVQLSYTEEGRYALAATILHPRTGRVIWFGIIQGEPGAADAPGTVASVTDALARAILPLG